MPMEIVPTYGNVMKVWWAYSWRWVVCLCITAVAAGAACSILAHVTGIATETSDRIGVAITLIVSLLAAPHWAIRRLLTRGFGHYRLALVEK